MLPGSGKPMRHPSSSSVAKKGKASSRLRFIILVPLALFLVGEIVTRSFAAYWADARPETAVGLPFSHPTAFLNLAEAELKAGQASEGDRKSVV